MKSFSSAITTFSSLMIALYASTLLGQTNSSSTAIVTYDQVQPVFKKHCVSCHGIERERGDLDLSSTEGIKSGSSSGPVVISGKPEESLLYAVTAHLESPRMPPGKAKIPQRELDLIRSWIEGGLREKPGKSIAATSVKSKAPSTTAATKEPVPNSITRSLPRLTAVTALAISLKDGSVAVSGLKEILVFPQGGATPPKVVPFPEGDLHALRYSRDGEWLIAGGGIGAESGKVVAFNAATGQRLFDVGNEADVVLAFDVSPDRRLIALGGPGRNVKLFRTSDQQLVHTLQKHTDWILSIAFSPDGLLLASGDRFGGLQIWEAATGKPFYSLRGHTGSVTAVAWGKTSDNLLSTGQDGFLRLWDMHRGSPIRTWNGELGGIVCAEWTTSGEIVAGGRQKQFAVFDPQGQRLRDWTMSDEVVELAVNSDGTQVIAGDASGHLAARFIANGELAGDYSIPVAEHSSGERTDNAAASVALSIPQRKPRSKPVNASSTDHASMSSPSPGASSEVTTDEARLQKTLEALHGTEAAIQATEESLAKLKTSAAALRQLIEAQSTQAEKPKDAAKAK
ncbi:c-type cytochrome domain-containing protein [Schlesneria sp.]|uniref:WD40 domain-containing protein n=1 Tax=Schlesneria sp. TaxID=2762018 RepID=UPI002EE5FF7B